MYPTHPNAMRILPTLLCCAAALIVTGCSETVVAPAPQSNVFAVNIVFSPGNALLNGSVASEQFRVPGITPHVVDRGAVLVYFRDQDTWTALPFTIGRESSELAAVDYTFTLGYAYDDGLVEIFLEASSSDEVVWQDIIGSLPESYTMKIVILSALPAGKNAVLDLRDYNAVRRYYSLQQ